MAKKTWTFNLQGRMHVVELEHGYWSGKRVISLDGMVLERSQKLNDTGSRHTFAVDGYQATLSIRTNALIYSFSLEIQGVPVKGEGEEIPVGGAPTLADSVASGPETLSPESVTIAAYAHMLREVRSWGFWSLGLGVLHLVGWDMLSAPWGVLLVLVGLGSFLFHDAAMFVVYGTTIAWAAFSNLLGGSAIWVVFAIAQAFLVLRVFYQFSHFRRAEQDFRTLAPAEAGKDPAAGRAARIFPALGCLLGVFALGGAQALFVAMIFMGENAPRHILSLLVEGVLNLAVLGLAVSLASLLARYRYRFLAALGIATSVVVIMLRLVLAFL